MAYNIIPKSLSELLKVHENAIELTQLYNDIQKKFNMSDPFAFDSTNLKKVKVHRAIDGNLDLKRYKTSFNLDFGNGSRGSGGSNNRGLLFEKDLFKDLNLYIEEGIEKVKLKQCVKDIIKLIPDGYYIEKISDDGELNQKRPLSFAGKSIYVGKEKKSSWDIGKTVTDLTVHLKNKSNQEKKLYLSLKLGSTVTFVNSGVTKYLKESEMKTGKIKNVNGLSLLDLFGIDNAKFCSIFNSYTGKGTAKEKVDITKNLKNSNIFKEFMESVIGYGYILVHKMGSTVYVQEIDEKAMKKFISVKKATILYPVNGSAKRIDVLVEMNGITIKINIRNKQGKLYPSHIMADYVIEH